MWNKQASECDTSKCGNEHIFAEPGLPPGPCHSLIRQAVTPLPHRRHAKSRAWQSGNDTQDTCPSCRSAKQSVWGSSQEATTAEMSKEPQLGRKLSFRDFICPAADSLVSSSHILQLISQEFTNQVPKSTSKHHNQGTSALWLCVTTKKGFEVKDNLGGRWINGATYIHIHRVSFSSFLRAWAHAVQAVLKLNVARDTWDSWSSCLWLSNAYTIRLLLLPLISMSMSPVSQAAPKES